uniref:Uncharacterized protein n=1 Tax=Tetranychus urticae TaxID=32264 RepID=T1K6P8_TETUR
MRIRLHFSTNWSEDVHLISSHSGKSKQVLVNAFVVSLLCH